MQTKLSLLVLSLGITLGCYHTAHLYPVQGPLAAKTPLPVLRAKITGGFTPRSVTVVLGDGEVCTGRWKVQGPRDTSAAELAAENGMPSVWDPIYGPGFYTAHVLGARYQAETVASGNRGTSLNLEMYVSEGGGAGIKGVGKDNQGNLYKLVW